MKFKFNHYKVSILISIFLLIIGTLGQIYSSNQSKQISNQGLVDLFHQVIYHVENNYVDETTKQDLWFGAIEGLLKSLDDPYTRFMTPEQFTELTSETQGQFGGLGIEITTRDSILTVVSPIEGTPAMRAGIEPGDQILQINEQSTLDMSLQNAVKLMRGKPGTSVKIGIKREDIDELLYFNIIRGIIKIETVVSDIIQPQNIGYIRLKQFSQPSYIKVKSVIQQFNKKKVKGLIFDLRWNPGGLLDSAYDIANLFIKEGIIVSTKGRNALQDKVFKASKNKAVANNIPLVILVNQGSASASEIVTGAVKDHKRGIVIGTKTFGKGSVQQIIPLSYNTAIALTIQKYYTPSGVSIHKKGIKPHKEIKPLSYTKEDRFFIKKIDKNKLIPEFIKTGKTNTHGKKYQYNKDTIKKFKSFLDKKKITLSDYSLKSILKSELTKKKKRPKYDLEFDVQLLEAIKHLNKK